MQKLESVHPFIEKIAKQKYSLDNIIVADICRYKIHCLFDYLLGPELGHIVLVHP